jgi:hypothetical protein
VPVASMIWAVPTKKNPNLPRLSKTLVNHSLCMRHSTETNRLSVQMFTTILALSTIMRENTNRPFSNTEKLLSFIKKWMDHNLWIVLLLSTILAWCTRCKTYFPMPLLSLTRL